MNLVAPVALVIHLNCELANLQATDLKWRVKKLRKNFLVKLTDLKALLILHNLLYFGLMCFDFDKP